MANSEAKSATAKQPKDAQVIQALLRDMGVTDYEPKVVAQLLEYSYQYVGQVLDDARTLSAHARKRGAPDLEDTRLAVQMRAEAAGPSAPPSREVLLEIARARNAAPLPPPRPTCGLRLPPDRHCLTACNYKLKFKPKPRPPGLGGSSLAISGAGNSQIYRGGIVLPQGGAGMTLAKPMMTSAVPRFSVMPQQPVDEIPKLQVNPPQAGRMPGVGGATPTQPVFKISMAPTQQLISGQKRKADEMEQM